MSRTTLPLRLFLAAVLILASAGSTGMVFAQEIGRTADGPEAVATHDRRILPKLDSYPSDACSGVSEIPPAECQALVALYESTNGPGWTNRDGWLVTNTPCNWYGVVCEAGHVRDLRLSNNQLSGSIPSELGSLVNLQYLDLRWNQLSGSIPPELGNLASLQHLDLGYNQLSGSIPSELGTLASLQSLDLSRNQLSGSIPPWLGNLVNLQMLDLSYNQLSGSIPSGLSKLGNLRHLYLDSNQLSGSIPSELGNLVELWGLGLSGNRLSGSIPPELGNLASLQYLYLSGNQLSGTLPRSLMNLHFSGFHFGDTHLCEPPDAAFQAWLATIPDLERSGLVCSVVYLPLCLR